MPLGNFLYEAMNPAPPPPGTLRASVQMGTWDATPTPFLAIPAKLAGLKAVRIFTSPTRTPAPAARLRSVERVDCNNARAIFDTSSWEALGHSFSAATTWRALIGPMSPCAKPTGNRVDLGGTGARGLGSR